MSNTEEGFKAYEEGDYVKAFRLLLPLAEAGRVEAQCSIGSMYHLGLGVETDLDKAIKWYSLAGQQGHPVAQNNLGLIYRFREGCEEKAFKWYRLAAEQGLPFAQDALGDMYASGCGTKRDNVQAVKWYRMAAERGFLLSCHNLGEMYAQGAGVNKDEQEAVKWFRLAAKQNYGPSQEMLGIAYSKGLLGLPRDSEKANYWLEKATANKTSK